MTTGPVHTLEELIVESTEKLELVKFLIKAAVLNPEVDTRMKCINVLNQTFKNILRRAYCEDGKIYACLKDSEQRLYTFYVDELPKTSIPSQPVAVYPFNLDAN